VTANFASTSKLSVSIRGNGNVTLDHADGLYQPNETATLHAEPLIGWSFIGWGSALSGSNPDATLPMETSKAVVANFTMTRENWTASCFRIEERANLSLSGTDADPDADGMPNWREWLQASDPKSALSRGQTPTSFDGSDCLFTYTRMECMPDGYSVSSVASDDLSHWSLPITERVIERTDGIETIEVRLDTTDRPQAFFSVTAQRPSN
jgi:hypothetical protein